MHTGCSRFVSSWSPLTLTTALADSCARWPDRPAVLSRRGTLTYGALQAAAHRLAVAYGVLGVVTGDRVVCSVSNRPELFVGLAATWQRGAIHVGIEHALTAPELARVVALTEASVVLYEPVAATRDACPQLEIVVVGGGERHGFEDLVAGDGDPVFDCAPGEDDPATMSADGATVETHREVYERCRSGDAHQLRMPLAYGAGLTRAVAGLLSGKELTLLDPVDPLELEAALRDSPRVADGAVLALDEVIRACVVPTGPEPRIRLGELRELLGRAFAPYALPDELHLLPAIPRTPLGAVDVAGLQAAIGVPHLVERRRRR